MSANMEDTTPKSPSAGNEGHSSGDFLSSPANSRSKPMPEIHREAIRKVQATLVEDLDVKDIMDHMTQSGIMNYPKRDVIMAESTRRDRVRTFLDILVRSGSNAFSVFLDALKEPYPHLWDVLQNQLQEDQNQHVEYVKCKEANMFNSREAASEDETSFDDIYEDYANPNFSDTEGYINVVAKKMSDDVCLQQPTMTMVCIKSCSAHVIRSPQKTASYSQPFNNYLERPLPAIPPTTNEGTDQSEAAASPSPPSECEEQETVPVSEGEILLLEETEGQRIRGSENRPTTKVLVWDKFGQLIQLPFCALRMYGDPFGEPWFYPITVSSQQVDLLLGKYKKAGIFLVYKPMSSLRSIHNDKIVFNLALVTAIGNKYIVIHHHIKGLPGGQVTMSDRLTFACIQDLVTYYKGNRAGLPCRLRQPPCNADRHISPGNHYDMKWHIEEDSMGWPSRDRSILSEGQFGKVIKAFKDNIPVAVKFQSTRQRVDPWSLEKFFEEAEILSKMDHKNVIQLQGFSMKRTPYIVMEYLPGGTLQDALKNRTVNKSFSNVVDMFKQILEALEYLESLMYVIHGDLAARNILIGEAQCLKLADFGLARMVTDDGFTAEENSEIPVRQSAPEVLRYYRFSTKSDVWSAGVLLWEILSTGHSLPYEDLVPKQIFNFLENGGRLSCPEGHPKATKHLFKAVTAQCWKFPATLRPSASTLLDIVSSHPRESSSSFPSNLVTKTQRAKLLRPGNLLSKLTRKGGKQSTMM